MCSDQLSSLNAPQREAVTHQEGNLLVLAGAGSGKTRVLVHRIAWLIQNGATANNVLAVTFTNKAALEMRTRLEEMLKLPFSSMWVGTFHGMAHRLLKSHWQEAGLPQAFQILDSEDQARLLRRIHKTLNLDLEEWPIKQSQAFINDNKDQMLRSNQVKAFDNLSATLLKIYQQYEAACEQSGVVDFGELLLRSYEMLKNNTEVLRSYRERFQNILIDEFQDTNCIQYEWVKLLAKDSAKLTVVGDDDQSIYGWRGAKFGNMQRYEKEYSKVKTIRLEENYRSTGNILAAANAVIAHNNNRLGKTLWTQKSSGEPITLYAAFNDIDEANFIVGKTYSWQKRGIKPTAIAVLYRSNAQSRVLEEEFIKAGIPYRIYGGLRFFERAEIKDVLAYLRLIVNHADDTAFERIINVPARGIGEVTLNQIREFAKLHNTSLYNAITLMAASNLFTARTQNTISSFLHFLTNAEEKVVTFKLGELIEYIIRASNIEQHYAKDNRERQQSRKENLEELVRAAEPFDYDANAFLAHAALESGDTTNNDAECVQLMTLHSAKGLEFQVVFLCGMEEGLFPHIMSMNSLVEFEEERRLCYVGMTRAMQKLYLLYADARRLHGTTTRRRPSRFLREIPVELLETDSIIAEVKKPMLMTNNVVMSNSFCGYMLGDRVFHSTFGEGVITAFEGQSENSLVQIKFARAGIKKLSLKYAKLEKR